MISLELNPTEKAWKEFLNKEEHLIFHTPKYKKFIEEAFNCQYTFVSVVDNETIQTTIPIVKIKSKLFGNKIISSAYLEYGGFAGRTEFVEKIIKTLDKKFKSDYNFLEIRGGLEEYDSVLSEKLVKKNLYKRFVLKLDGEEKVWNKFRQKTRTDIRRGIKNNLTIGRGWHFLDQFYKVYVQNMIQNNAVIHSKKYFIDLSKNLGEKASLFVVLDGSKVIAGMVVLYSKTVAEFYIGAWNRKYAKKSPYSFMFWNAITDAINKGIEKIDMGESRLGSGTYKYKVNFGGSPVVNESACIEEKNRELQTNNRFVKLFIINGIKLILSLKFFSKFKYFYLIRSRKNNKIV